MYLPVNEVLHSAVVTFEQWRFFIEPANIYMYTVSVFFWKSYNFNLYIWATHEQLSKYKIKNNVLENLTN